MRKIYFLILTVFSFLSINVDSIAQTTVTIPAANTNSGGQRYPLGTFFGFERSAIIYTAAELGGIGGQIQKVAFYVNSVASPQTMVDTRIYLKTRNDIFTTTTTYANEIAGATQVYGPVSIAPATAVAGQWLTITLSTPFPYNGSGNLEVIVETNATGGGNEGSTGKQFRYTTQSDGNLFQTWAADNAAPAGSGTLRPQRPNIQLTIQEPPCVPGALSGGTTTSSVAASCAGTNFTLSVTGASVGSGMTYQWQSSPDGSTWTDIPSATSSILSTSQVASTHYRRKMTCSGTDEYSAGLLVNAAPPVPLPFTETFSNYATTFPPDCWTRNSSFILGDGASAFGNGTGSVMFNFYSTSATIDLATSVFAATPANYRLTFDHAYATFSGENDRLQILFSTNGGQTYTSLITYNGGETGPLNTGGADFFPFTPTSGQWASKSVSLPAGTNRLMFRGISAFGNNLFVDNIRVEETPPCLPPDNLRLTGATTNSITFDWDASVTNAAGGYDWEVRTSGAAGSGATGLAASGSVAAGVLTATATGLNPNTRYNIYVRANCGVSVFSGWTLAVPGSTLCDAANVPYVQNFDGALTADNLPECLVVQDLNGGGKWALWTLGGGVVTSGTNSIRYEWNGTTPANDWFFIRGLNLEAGKTYTLSFKYKASDGPDYVENLEVKYGLAPNAAAMTSAAIFSETNISTNVNDPFASASVTFTVPANGVYYLGFRSFSDADQAFLYIDDVAVETCASPANVTAISPTSTTAEVSFTSPGTSFIVEYGTVGFTPGIAGTAGVGGTIVTGTASPITITGLAANTLYDIYVRQDCSAGEYSLNTKVTVRTQCAPTNVPYVQNFNASPSPGVPNCTSIQDLNGNPSWLTAIAPPEWGFEQTVLYYEYDPNKPANDWFYTQGLNLVGGTTYELAFKYGSIPGFPESLRVAYGTGATASAMTTTIVDYPSIQGNANPPFANLARVTFTPAATGVYYVGFNVYSAPDQFYMLLDSIHIKAQPLVDVGVLNLTNAPTCPANNLVLKATLHNYNLLPIDFSVNPITVSANITGSATQTLTTVINSGTLAAGANLVVDLPAFTFTAGVYNITTSSSSVDDTETSNDANTILLVTNGSPAAAVFTPAAPQVCEGGTVQVSSQFVNPAPAPTEMAPVSSGAISVAIPDNSVVGASTTLNVSGVPGSAQVTGIKVTINATHTWNSDLLFNLRAPNGRILNLVAGRGGSGDGFSNAVISSTGTTALPSGATTPITGTFAPDALAGVGPTGGVSNATSFTDLYTVGNGTWTLYMQDGFAGDVGTLTSWSITITYGTPNPVVTWTPITGLFTNAAATTAYVANSNAATVYAKPAGTTTYTATTTSAFGCTTTSDVTVTVNPNPVITLSALPARICVSDTLVPLAAAPAGGTWSGIGVSGNFVVPPSAAPGTFTLSYQYTNNFGCTSVASTPLKIEDCPERLRLLRDDAVILFPNPNNGQFNIRINSTLYNKLIMTVYTNTGLVARRQQFNGLAYGRVIPVDLTALPSGPYMVQFYYEGGPRTSDKTFKVIVGR